MIWEIITAKSRMHINLLLTLKPEVNERFGQFRSEGAAGIIPVLTLPGTLNQKKPIMQKSPEALDIVTKHFFIDMGVSALLQDEKYSLYYNNIADLALNRYRFLTTFGFRF